MRSGSYYDVPTAVTFLMAGLGIGSLLAIMFAPRRSRQPLTPRVVEAGVSAEAGR